MHLLWSFKIIFFIWRVQFLFRTFSKWPLLIIQNSICFIGPQLFIYMLSSVYFKIYKNILRKENFSRMKVYKLKYIGQSIHVFTNHVLYLRSLPGKHSLIFWNFLTVKRSKLIWQLKRGGGSKVKCIRCWSTWDRTPEPCSVTV